VGRGCAARLARTSGDQPADGRHAGRWGIGVSAPDVIAEHRRLSEIGGIDLDPEPMQTPGAPLLFMLRDPDGNNIAVVQAQETDA
jgi:lactoylglutathione lyase